MRRPPLVALLAIPVLLALVPVPRTARADEESPRLRAWHDEIDRSIDAGLAFLVRKQQTCPRGDGSFEDWNGETNAIAGLTGMACLAKGHLPGDSPHGRLVERTIDYIVGTQSDTGYLGVRGCKMYGHAIATLYLSEVSGMIDPARQARIDPVLARAAKVILDAQAANPMGAWRYEPTSTDADISVTGWNLMALRSLRLNGAGVPKAAIDRALSFVDSCTEPGGGGGYFYHTPSWYRRGYWLGGPANAARTSVALLCRELSGLHGDQRSEKAADWLAAMLAGMRGEDYNDPYTMYYAAQALFQVGGPRWEAFAERLYKHAVEQQQPDGSWQMKPEQGQVYPTAMMVLALTVTYRQLPIYQR
ncbi:MAG: terpene cyclase/mutase family protein [Planctomycetes bacterium]|nr:terpene cyclase/mutase family protein [Planctomycetota bacterium]